MLDDLRTKNERRSLIGGCLLIAGALACPIPGAGLIALISSALGNSSSADVFWLLYLTVVACILAGPLLLSTGNDQRLLSLLTLREVRPEEQWVNEVLQQLCIAAGITAPPLGVQESERVNAAVVGLDPQVTIVVTTAALQLPRKEFEALLAMAVSREALVGKRFGAILNIVSAPEIAGRWMSCKNKRVAVPPLLSIASIAAATAATWLATQHIADPVTRDDARHLGTLFLPAVVGGAICIWSFMHRIALRFIVYPAELGADAVALSLTRYPPPMRNVLARKDVMKRRFMWNYAEFDRLPIWVLPTARDRQTVKHYENRLAQIDSLDPAAAKDLPPIALWNGPEHLRS